MLLLLYVVESTELKIAIYGYDTIVGKQVLEELENSTLAIEEFFPLSPMASEYDAVPLKGKNYLISYVDEFDFSKAQVALFLTTKDETERLLAKAQGAGCIVIDNSHLFAGTAGMPVCLPQVNPYIIKDIIARKLAVVPSAASSEIVLSLQPLHDEYGVRKAVITALISASEHGETGTQTLARETAQLLNGMSIDPTDFPSQLAFNIHTRVGKVQESGQSIFESGVESDVFSLLDPFAEGLSLTCLQVPVFYGHTLQVHVDLEEDASLEEVKALFKDSKTVCLEEDVVLEKDVDGEENEQQKDFLVSPVSCAELENKIFISRIRKQGRASFDFSVVMDNTRHGEASTIVELSKLLQLNLA